MRVGVFGIRGFPFVQGGVEKHCECIYPLLKDCRITVFRRKPYIASSNATYPNIRFVDLPSTRITGVEALIHSMLSAFCNMFLRPQIVHIHNIGPGLFAPILKLMGIKVVLTYHSPNYEHDKWHILAKILLRLCEKIALATSDAVIFVSEMQLKKFSPRIQAKSCFIPNGIEPPALTPEMDYLKSLGVKTNKYILAVGRITPEKGFDCLIDSFEKGKFASYHLVIAGGVEGQNTYYAQLQKSAASGRVIFAGHVYGQQLAQLYTHAALFVLPSRNEGMPIALLEAMSYGLSVLASDIPANLEVQLPADCYFHYSEACSDSLCEAIDAKLRLPYAKREYNLERYDWNAIAEKTLGVYNAIAKHGRL
ncbi:MAG: glycosyltransferase family 4 protein [Tannerellaceae bacterium]|jgi:glycosyltransferase involved in cell wall biosynthesis|nr:glycosyltransferase family 4 protein [Tannerellaceae bacterium]